MKRFTLFTLVGILMTSYGFAAAINCNTLPQCSDLGYTDVAAQCPKGVIKCPFDTTQGKCIHDAAIGQIGYFTKYPGKGWLLCNGATFSKTTYPELASFLGTQFCVTYHGSSCSSATFAVPNYLGYFLRVYGTPNSSFGKTGNTNFTYPQAEGLPNITANWRPGNYSGNVDPQGAVYMSADNSDERGGNSKGSRIYFNASRSSPIYGRTSGVTPPNLAVYAYIYAGKVVQ